MKIMKKEREAEEMELGRRRPKIREDLMKDY